ncbi:TrkA family potassium uptake protein [Sesbania bispinosa]|nr:TrkA family potassium uptake protein [Sesbania bispinosa]
MKNWRRVVTIHQTVSRPCTKKQRDIMRGILGIYNVGMRRMGQLEKEMERGISPTITLELLGDISKEE